MEKSCFGCANRHQPDYPVIFRISGCLVRSGPFFPSSILGLCGNLNDPVRLDFIVSVPTLEKSLCVGSKRINYIWKVCGTGLAAPLLAKQCYSAVIFFLLSYFPANLLSGVSIYLSMSCQCMVPVRHSVASLAWQVHIHSLQSILLGVVLVCLPHTFSKLDLINSFPTSFSRKLSLFRIKASL